MRLYLALEREHLEALASGSSVTAPAYFAASTDEDDELAALEEAAETGVVAAAAEVDDEDAPVSLHQVESFHLDDGTGGGHLTWYAAQELDAVIAQL